MDHVQDELQKLLAGESVPTGAPDCCHQKIAHEPPIRTKQTVGYIVCGVVFNDAGEVLMMQEAKRSCYGKWYLPAGRMEPDETIVDAVKREVLEETGLEMEPTTLICVEVQGPSWYRFTFTGKVTGGQLKTTDQNDSESLQARWFTRDQIRSPSSCSLRATDILKLIDIGVAHRSSADPHPSVLPHPVPHEQLLLRPVFVAQDRNSGSLKILVSYKGKPHIPVSSLSPADYAFSHALDRVLWDALVKPAGMKEVGVLALEYCGKPAHVHDGICMTLLVWMGQSDMSALQTKESSSYTWETLQGDLEQLLKERLHREKTVRLLMLLF